MGWQAQLPVFAPADGPLVGTWLNPPLSAVVDGDDLVVVTGDRTDFWRTTSYGGAIGFARWEGSVPLVQRLSFVRTGPTAVSIRSSGCRPAGNHGHC